MRRFQTVIAIIAAVLIISTAAIASIAWQKIFMDNYKPKADTALAKAKCQICHTKGAELNLYGKALNAKPKTAASLKAVEKLDSDKDGFTNLEEIKAGTLPGDPKSKPAGKPAKPAK